MAKTKTKKVKQFFYNDEVVVAFETAIHARLILTVDPETGEVEVEVAEFTIPSWMTNFEREQAVTAFMYADGQGVDIANLPDEAFEALAKQEADVSWE